MSLSPLLVVSVFKSRYCTFWCKSRRVAGGIFLLADRKLAYNRWVKSSKRATIPVSMPNVSYTCSCSQIENSLQVFCTVNISSCWNPKSSTKYRLLEATVPPETISVRRWDRVGRKRQLVPSLDFQLELGDTTYQRTSLGLFQAWRASHPPPKLEYTKQCNVRVLLEVLPCLMVEASAAAIR